MSDRRAHRRIDGSSLPGLSACTGSASWADILDISRGGILIETPVRMKPGQREIVLLSGTATIKVVGWAERVEISRLFPVIAYRTALRFARPVTVGAVGRFLALDISKAIEIAPAESQPSIDEPEPPVEDPRTVENTVESWLQGVSSVHAVRVSALVARLPGTEPVHFAVPASSRGNKRMLQVFFALGARPTTAEFAQLRQCAERASTLPDLDFVSSPRYLRMLDGGRRAAVADR